MCVGDRLAQAIEARRAREAWEEEEQEQAALRAAAAEAATTGAPSSAPLALGFPSTSPPLPPPAWESAARTGILVFWSSCVSSPWWTWWYGWLNAKFPSRVFLAVGLTAALPAPLWNAAFFAFSTAAEHAALAPDPWATRDVAITVVREKLSTQLLPTVQRSAMLWIPVNIVNFTFVPVELRMLTGTLVSFAWNCYLSLVGHSHPGVAGAGAGAAVVAETRVRAGAGAVGAAATAATAEAANLQAAGGGPGAAPHGRTIDWAEMERAEGRRRRAGPPRTEGDHG